MGQAQAEQMLGYRPQTHSRGYPWLPAYASGLDDIDAMHRAMVERLDLLDRIVRRGEGGGAAALRDLERVTRRHFEQEERLLEPLGSFGAATHQREHGHLLRLLGDGAELCSATGHGQQRQEAALPAYMRIVGRWLLHEITANDHRLIAATRARRSAPRFDL